METMLDVLNDDCQLYLLKFLRLQDHVHLKEISPRLSDNVRYHWRHRPRFALNLNLRAFKTEESLAEFLEDINTGLQTLYLSHVISLRRIHRLNFQFTNVRRLIYQEGYDDDDDDLGHDEHIRIMSIVFPALTSLELHSFTTGQYLWQLPTIVDLNLNGCEYLDTALLPRIFSSMQLRRLSIMFSCYVTSLESGIIALTNIPTLEELAIDDYHMRGTFMDSLARMPKLRMLSFWTRDSDSYVVAKLVNLRGPDIRTMMCNDSMCSSGRLVDCVCMMQNLHRLQFEFDSITESQLRQIGANCRHLEELQFRATPFEMGCMISIAIIHVRSLKILDVCDNTISEHSVINTAHELRAALDARRTPLKMHCRRHVMNSDLMKRLFTHPKLMVKHELAFTDEIARHMMRITFEPLEP